MALIKYILIYTNPETESNQIEYFAELENVTNYLNTEKLLPSDVNVYEVAKEVQFKVVPMSCVQKDVDKQ
ncbi:MAG: hypothetical protein WC998_03485 [Candidatus Paceibacterota bacterium]